jgi:AcrR family transcriptional regulator
MTTARIRTAATPRKMSREVRRDQLIQATIETLALRGYASTTLTEVARTAGLSHGLANFHFESKENLLAATLNFLSEEYRQNWQGHLDAAGPSPAAQLAALLRADLDPALCTQTRLSAWLAFWGEAQGRPLYQKLAARNDEDYILRMEDIVGRLLAEGRYGGDAALVARVLRNTTEGVWLDMMTMTRPLDLAEAEATILTCAAAFFPRHFTAGGLIAPD